MLSYPLWLLLFTIVPISILWIIKFNTLKKYYKVIAFAVVGSIVFSLPWDIIAIHERIWYFTQPHIFGIYIVGLPIEEWLFMTFVTILFTIITLILWEKYKR